jgi:hypothetical protein
VEPDPINEVVRRLNAVLGPTLVSTLVSTLAGSTDVRAALRRAQPDTELISPAFEANVRLAYRAMTAISEAANTHVAYAWFIASNPMLGEDTPVQAIREGRHRQVVAALSAMVDGTWAG